MGRKGRNRRAITGKPKSPDKRQHGKGRTPTKVPGSESNEAQKPIEQEGAYAMSPLSDPTQTSSQPPDNDNARTVTQYGATGLWDGQMGPEGNPRSFDGANQPASDDVKQKLQQRLEVVQRDLQVHQRQMTQHKLRGKGDIRRRGSVPSLMDCMVERPTRPQKSVTPPGTPFRSQVSDPNWMGAPNTTRYRFPRIGSEPQMFRPDFFQDRPQDMGYAPPRAYTVHAGNHPFHLRGHPNRPLFPQGPAPHMNRGQMWPPFPRAVIRQRPLLPAPRFTRAPEPLPAINTNTGTTTTTSNPEAQQEIGPEEVPHEDSILPKEQYLEKARALLDTTNKETVSVDDMLESLSCLKIFQRKQQEEQNPDAQNFNLQDFILTNTPSPKALVPIRALKDENPEIAEYCEQVEKYLDCLKLFQSECLKTMPSEYIPHSVRIMMEELRLRFSRLAGIFHLCEKLRELCEGVCKNIVPKIDKLTPKHIMFLEEAAKSVKESVEHYDFVYKIHTSYDQPLKAVQSSNSAEPAHDDTHDKSQVPHNRVLPVFEGDESVRPKTTSQNFKIVKRPPRRMDPPASAVKHEARSALQLPPLKVLGQGGVQTGRPTVEEDKEEEKRLTRCPTCKTIFKWPQVLQCCHAFCYGCVKRLIDKVKKKHPERSVVRCTICNTATTVPDMDPYNVDLDYARCHAMCMKGVSPFTCTNCARYQDSKVYCKTCKHYLCQICENEHDTNKTLKTHEVTDELVVCCVEGKLYPTCQLHPKQICDRYCRVCKDSICEKCEEESHTGHTVVLDSDCEEFMVEVKTKVYSCNERILGTMRQLRIKIQSLKVSKQNLDGGHRSALRRVNDFINWSMGRLQECGEEMHELLDDISAHAIFVINELSKAIDRYHSELVAFSGYTGELLRFGTPASVLTLMPHIDRQRRRLGLGDDIEHELEPFTNGLLILPYTMQFEFNPNYPEMSNFMSSIFSNIRTHSSISLDALRNSPHIGDRLADDPTTTAPYGISIWASLDERRQLPPTEGNCGDKMGASVGPEHDLDKHMAYDYPRKVVTCFYSFGSYGSGPRQFAEPSGILYLHDGNLAVCDTSNHRILLFDGDQFEHLDTIGQPPNVPPLPDTPDALEKRGDRYFERTPGKLYYPFRLAQCPLTNVLIVVERPPSLTIQIFKLDGKHVRSFGNDVLKYPRGVSVDEKGDIFVVEGRTMRILVFSHEGIMKRSVYLSLDLDFPNDIDVKKNFIYISDNRSHCVHVYSYQFEKLIRVGHESVTYYPIGVGLNKFNELVVTDNHNTFNVSVFDCYGKYLFGLKSRARYANVYNVALHPKKRLMAATTRDNQVLVFRYEVPADDRIKNMVELIPE